jgi:tRNA(fMet)-specific endonuclease VapC
MVIFDTNILIELYRGNNQIKEQVLGMDADVFYISSITVAEFLSGARNKSDMAIIAKQLDKYTRLPITTEISDIFLKLFQKYSLSHKPGIPDTLIAAISAVLRSSHINPE